MAASKVPKLSATARACCCKFCAEPEKKGKRFLICGHSLCMYKYYHIQCMIPGQIASEPQLGMQRWYCPSCLCRECFLNTDDNKIILCDRCDEAYHLYCLKPPRTSVPKGDWYCQSCTEKKARQEEMKTLEQKILKLHRKSDRAILKSNKPLGLEVLMSAIDESEEQEAKAEKLRLKEEAASPAAAPEQKLTGNEEAAMATEKPAGDEEAAAITE